MVFFLAGAAPSCWHWPGLWLWWIQLLLVLGFEIWNDDGWSYVFLRVLSIVILCPVFMVLRVGFIILRAMRLYLMMAWLIHSTEEKKKNTKKISTPAIPYIVWYFRIIRVARHLVKCPVLFQAFVWIHRDRHPHPSTLSAKRTPTCHYHLVFILTWWGCSFQ